MTKQKCFNGIGAEICGKNKSRKSLFVYVFIAFFVKLFLLLLLLLRRHDTLQSDTEHNDI
jgi:hypothetical protein